jgi:hypothetical protein
MTLIWWFVIPLCRTMRSLCRFMRLPCWSEGLPCWFMILSCHYASLWKTNMRRYGNTDMSTTKSYIASPITPVLVLPLAPPLPPTPEHPHLHRRHPNFPTQIPLQFHYIIEFTKVFGVSACFRRQLPPGFRTTSDDSSLAKNEISEITRNNDKMHTDTMK